MHFCYPSFPSDRSSFCYYRHRILIAMVTMMVVILTSGQPPVFP